MNIHEYQAKALLKSFGVCVSKGVAVLDAKDAESAAATLPGPLYVVKAQIHAGGRGKGRFKEASAGDKGGVRLARSPAEAAEFTRQMLGATLVTNARPERRSDRLPRLQFSAGATHFNRASHRNRAAPAR